MVVDEVRWLTLTLLFFRSDDGAPDDVDVVEDNIWLVVVVRVVMMKMKAVMMMIINSVMIMFINSAMMMFIESMTVIAVKIVQR